MSVADSIRRGAAMAASWLVRRRGLYGAVSVAELPNSLKPHTIYVVGEARHRWYAAFLCPCGCGETIQASLLEKSRPHWTLTERWDGAASLHPSVWRTKGCRSHFWLRVGRIRWC
jgi:Family of unknown function (DUF6527)